MSDMRLNFTSQLAGLDGDDWVSAVEDLSEDHGYFEFLGPKHFASFLQAGPKLLVTFENADTIRENLPGAEPRGYAFTRHDGWSHLALVSEGESWFRDGYVYRYFDRLIDDGFFEDFDDVLFYGAHAGAYAAAAFSVAAPGARVIAIRPQATLDPRITGWDNRHISDRKQDFNSRYGYAPEMIDAAERAYIVFNPAQRLDAMHAALFTKSNVTMLRSVGLGWKLDSIFDAIDCHDDLIRMAMAGDLNPESFGVLMQKRKSHNVYLRGLLKRAQAAGHDKMSADVCAYVLRQKDDPFFAAELEKLQDAGFAPRRPLQTAAAE